MVSRISPSEYVALVICTQWTRLPAVNMNAVFVGVRKLTLNRLETLLGGWCNPCENDATCNWSVEEEQRVYSSFWMFQMPSTGTVETGDQILYIKIKTLRDNNPTEIHNASWWVNIR